ncbi:unnamed protein product, partial [Symbiodinium microadriaticum]
DRRELLARDRNGESITLDAEGLTVARSQIFVSTEPSRLFRLPDWGSAPWESPSVPLEAELLAHQPSEYFTGELPNQGLEALTSPRTKEAVTSIVTGIEGPLVQDDPRVRRVLE